MLFRSTKHSEARKIVRGTGRYGDQLEKSDGKWLVVRVDYSIVHEQISDT